jgi:hypothetical protein
MPQLGLSAAHTQFRLGFFERAHLFATAHGVPARPCNEAVEMVDYERALGRPAFRAALLNEITADPAWQPTFVFYMGYPKLSAHASPSVRLKLYSSDGPDPARSSNGQYPGELPLSGLAPCS